MDKAEVVAGDWVFILLAQELDVIDAFDQLLDRVWISTRAAIVELNGADILLRTMRSLNLALTFQLFGNARRCHAECEHDKKQRDDEADEQVAVFRVPGACLHGYWVVTGRRCRLLLVRSVTSTVCSVMSPMR